MRKKYDVVATGGTFDVLHKGHRRLLETAFDVSSVRVIIGLTSDEMLAVHDSKKTILYSYAQRHANLDAYLRKTHSGSAYVISRLDNDFGPAVFTEEVRALVASEETAQKGAVLNELRLSRGLKPVDVVVVPMVMAYDSNRISSSRIRSCEIDADGNALK